MADSKTIDMTQGSPLRHITFFALPTLLGYLFQQFYSMVDTIIIGQYLGNDALAAAGSTGSINFMIIGFCVGICSGFGIPVAQRFGAKDYSNMRKYIANGIWLSIIFAGIITTIVCVFCMNILTLMKTPDNIIQDAYIYIFIIFLGIPTTILYNLTSSIIRSLGDSKTPVIFLVISSVINIVLDILMVKPMGIAGPAWATVISQGISGILCLIYMNRKFEILKIRKSEWQFDTHCIKQLCIMGLPMGLQYSITAIGSVILQTAVNKLGSGAVAAVTAGTKIGCFFCCPFDALGSTAATFGGQNVGAGKLSRIGQGLKVCNIIGFIYSAIALGILYFFGDRLALLFMDQPDPVLISQTHEYLIWNALFYSLLTLVNVVRFLIQGMGFSMFAILAGVFEMAARAACGFILVPLMGYFAVCIASPLAWAAADLFLIPAYFIVMRKLKNIQNGENDRITAKIKKPA